MYLKLGTGDYLCGANMEMPDA